MPGDAITMLLEAAPLYLLFELGVLLAAFIDRRAAPRGSVAAGPNSAR
jgi:Sec-independent protein secretion pathway component TatC